MTAVQTLLEELDELHSRLMALMVEFPQFQELKIEEVTYLEALRDIANLKDQPTELRLKLGTEAVQFIKVLLGAMLKDTRYSNTWPSVRPIYRLANNLLVIETD